MLAGAKALEAAGDRRHRRVEPDRERVGVRPRGLDLRFDLRAHSLCVSGGARLQSLELRARLRLDRARVRRGARLQGLELRGHLLLRRAGERFELRFCLGLQGIGEGDGAGLQGFELRVGLRLQGIGEGDRTGLQRFDLRGHLRVQRLGLRRGAGLQGLELGRGLLGDHRFHRGEVRFFAFAAAIGLFDQAGLDAPREARKGFARRGSRAIHRAGEERRHHLGGGFRGALDARGEVGAHLGGDGLDRRRGLGGRARLTVEQVRFGLLQARGRLAQRRGGLGERAALIGQRFERDELPACRRQACERARDVAREGAGRRGLGAPHEDRAEPEHRRRGHARRRRSEGAREPHHRRREAGPERVDVAARRQRFPRSAKGFEEAEEGAEHANHHQQAEQVRREGRGGHRAVDGGEARAEQAAERRARRVDDLERGLGGERRDLAGEALGLPRADQELGEAEHQPDADQQHQREGERIRPAVNGRGAGHQRDGDRAGQEDCGAGHRIGSTSPSRRPR